MQLDKGAVRTHADRAAASYDNVSVLQQRVADELLERIKLIKIAPKRVLDLGCGTGYSVNQLESLYRGVQLIGIDVASRMLYTASRKRRWLSAQRFAVGDAEMLPIRDDTLDMVVSNLTLEWCDPDAVFGEIWRVLRPGGLLIFSTFGPDTLRELRAAWLQTDACPHVHDFLDMHDLGDGLIRARFATPVVDVDRITVTYKRVPDVLSDLRQLGVQNASMDRRRALTGRVRFKRFQAAYESQRNQSGLIPTTCEVVYGHAWAPEDKRARPGEPGIATVPVDQIRRGRP